MYTSTIEDVVVPSRVLKECEYIVLQHEKIRELRSHGIEPNSRVLITGDSGNGQIELACAIGNSLLVPTYFVKYDAIIGNTASETTRALENMFQRLQYNHSHCVVIFDEFDTIAADRSLSNSVQGIVGIVGALKMQLEMLPSHVLVIAISSRSAGLDTSIYNLFAPEMRLRPLSADLLMKLIHKKMARLPFAIDHNARELVDVLSGYCVSHVDEFFRRIVRKKIVTDGSINVRDLVDSCINDVIGPS
jgi:AAA+ superfamily predicted ATPase